MQEEWKDIKGFEGYYQVSNRGDVRSLVKRCGCRIGGTVEHQRIRVLSPTPNSRGYRIVQLMMDKMGYKSFTVHSLVGNHFLVKPCYEDYTTINHKDGNKLNNCVDNLEWVTHKENMRHAFATGLIKGNGRKAKTAL